MKSKTPITMLIVSICIAISFVFLSGAILFWDAQYLHFAGATIVGTIAVAIAGVSFEA